LFFGGLGGLMMTGVDQWMMASDVLDQAYQGVSLGLSLMDRIDRYAAMQVVDAEWASNWNWSDDWFAPVPSSNSGNVSIAESGPAVASAWRPIGPRTHGGYAHNTTARNEIMNLLDKYEDFGYNSRRQMSRQIRFDLAASDLDGNTLSNLRPDIAFLNKRTGKIDVIEIQWAAKVRSSRREDLRKAYGDLMGDFHVVEASGYITTKWTRYKGKPTRPGTKMPPPRRRR
jgi:hypothetical protein